MPPKKAEKKPPQPKAKTPNNASAFGRIFRSWNDEDFFGPKASHIFLYGEINAETVQLFRNQLHEACLPQKNKKAKPIVIHIHSPGGHANLGITLVNVLREIPVPVAVIVDGYACSAVTPLLVAAPYRVMHDFSFVLFHEISFDISQPTSIRDVELSYLSQSISSTYQEYRKIYESHTRIPKSELDEIILRDIFLDSKICTKYNVVDRVISLGKQAAHKRWASYMASHPGARPTNDPLTWAPFLNHLFSYAKPVNVNANAKNNATEQLLQLIKPMHTIQIASKVETPLVIHTNSYFAPSNKWFDIATLMVHIHNMKVPVIGVIDSKIDIIKAIPAILSYKRYMYDNAHLTISLLYEHQHVGAKYYHDIKYNTELLRTTLRHLLQQYTRLPRSILDTLFDKRVILNAKECKEYGIIDDIIPSLKRSPKAMSGGCGCSQGLAYGSGPF